MTAGEFGAEIEEVVDLFLDRHKGAKEAMHQAIATYKKMARESKVSEDEIDEILSIAAYRIAKSMVSA